jgi:hypothetical protein
VLDEGSAHAAAPVGLRDAHLVQEHLRSLVGMNGLDATDEADGHGAVVRDEQMMASLGKKSRGRVRPGSVIEQIAGGHDLVGITGT